MQKYYIAIFNCNYPMNYHIKKLYDILTIFLGESKKEYCDGVYQYQFPCPKCIEREGVNETYKYNLEVNLKKQVFQCWKCASLSEDMKGSIVKLIKQFGSESLLSEYKAMVHSLRECELYKLHFSHEDFIIHDNIITNDELLLPLSFKDFSTPSRFRNSAYNYLRERGITDDIIDYYHIGYTEKENDEKMYRYSYRIIIPSYDEYGEMNYWVGRDYIPHSMRMKYANPQAEKKDIIFNENNLQWDADITLVEGPFDHIVVPNSVPLLGKTLTNEYSLYWKLLSNAHANINIFLDGDAVDTVKAIYKLLNHGKLYGKIRYIPVNNNDDPSSLFKDGGYKKIAEHLKNAQQIPEIYL